MYRLSFKWVIFSALGCAGVGLLIQFYLYNSVKLTYIINDLFLAGLLFFCAGGLAFVIQSGFFDVPINAIKMFWRTVSRLGKWIRENEYEKEDKPLYDYEKRKRRHPLAFSSACVGLFFCLMSFVLSLFSS